jgi:hypothetical protein
MLAVVMVALASAAASAQPAWRIDSLSNTTAAPGGSMNYLVQVTNTGDQGADGTLDPIVLGGSLPSGVQAQSITVTGSQGQALDCSGTPFPAGSFTCTDSGDVVPDATSGATNNVTVRIAASVDAGVAAAGEAHFQVSGGGAGAVTTVDPTRFTSATPTFGIDAFDDRASENAAGGTLTQAAAHPYDLTTDIDFNTERNPAPLLGDLWPVEATKDVSVDLPPGLVGKAAGVAQCTLSQLANSTFTSPLPLCPPASQVGTVVVRFNAAFATSALGPLPVFNLVPPPGVPAQFGFNFAGVVVTLNAAVRSGTDYGLTVNVQNISEGLSVAGNSVTFWGVPADPVHDPERACSGQLAPAIGGPSCQSGAPRTAFLRNPTSCTPAGVGVQTALHIDSWVHPATFNADGSPNLSDPRWQSATFASHASPGYPAMPSEWGPEVGIEHCEKVPFTPTLSGTPAANARAGGPSGFSFDVNSPQSDDPTSLGEADLKKAVVTLPEGVRVNPSSADGLQGCSPEQFALRSNTEPTCPDASKLGTMEIDSPLLDTPLTGSVYLAKPFDNPFGSLLAVYLVASAKGVVIKVPGEVRTDPDTGQITATFDNNPQLPFTRVHMEFNGGPRAPLTLPSTCGPHTTRAVFTGWNGKIVTTKSTFTVSDDGHGAPCADARFSPRFTAGTQNPIAGGFSPFGLQLTRTDSDGEFRSLSTLSLPKGLLANVASITTRCTIEQADTHSCPADSHIGEVTVGAGAGPTPFYVGGDVYLTTPYKGNPFGVAVIVHAQAGPFDLGYVVVKGAIQIHDDGSVTVATDPFPTILQGIPLQVKDIRVNLDRPGFMFNPTSCNPMSIDGTVVSTANQQAGVSSRFQVGECANLAFKPSFTVSTTGKTSKANGASLHVHLATHEGPSSAGAARESNIAKVDVQLPVVLPARLPTLQKACTAAQFAANPAGCPAGSFVGTAIAHTPILASPLSGPAILVSHGGQAFPDLVLVLQGEGVRLNLTGHTQIKKGITYNHFETVPDAPVSSFDLTLPAGPHGVLTTDVPGRNLCANTRTVTVTKRVTRRINGHTRRVTVKAKKAVAAPLLMPTTMTAQNGAIIHQNTKIAVTGCAAVKTKGRKATTKKGARKK